MKAGHWRWALLLCLWPSAVHAQTRQPQTTPAATEQTSLRQQLMPSSEVLRLNAPAVTRDTAQPAENASRPAVYARRSGTAYMIVGAALFAGGLIAGGDAGTILILAGAGFGGYGLYLHFR